MKGLYNKYTIIKNETGKKVTDRCFVLKPDQDPAAREALRTYAKATKNEELAKDLLRLANYEFVSCGCRGLADCGHMFGGYEQLREEVEQG